MLVLLHYLYLLVDVPQTTQLMPRLVQLVRRQRLALTRPLPRLLLCFEVAADPVLVLPEHPLVPVDVGVEVGMGSLDEVEFLFGFEVEGGWWEELRLLPDPVVIVVGEGEHFVEESVIAGVFFHF